MTALWLGLPVLSLFPAAPPTNGVPAVAPGPATVSLRSVAQNIETLTEEYEDAVLDWRDLYREAKSMEARRALKARHPALEFWPRFQALADAGEGRALLWMTDNLRDKGLKSKEARAETARLLGVLASDYVEAEWFGDVLEAVASARRSLADGQDVEIYKAAFERNPDRAVKAHALHRLSESLKRAEDESARAESERLLVQLSEEFEDTPHGKEAAGLLFERRHLSVGKIAPDFEGTTIDGHEFKLSDYRGKVVLVDFYGFW